MTTWRPKVYPNPDNLERCPRCTHPIIGVAPAPDLKGVATVRPDSEHCCSEYEGELETPELQAEQACITWAHIVRLQAVDEGRAR